MARPLRIVFEGAWYHVMNRGAGRRAIFPTDEHRETFLALLGEMAGTFGVEVHAYCLMSTHYHLLLHTRRGNLSDALRHLNGIYTQRHNRQRRTDGPLFRGRFKAILVDADSYLAQLSRYIHLNPVPAKIPEHALDTPWSRLLAQGTEQPGGGAVDCIGLDIDAEPFGFSSRVIRRPSYAEGLVDLLLGRSTVAPIHERLHEHQPRSQRRN